VKQLIIILISIAGALFSLAQDQPKVVGQLVSKRDEAFKKANEAFMVKVVKLQSKYTKNGDIESAKKLAALINDSADQDYKSYPSAARGFAATRDQDFKRINEIFIRELVKIQSNYTTSGDFENAKKVASFIIGKGGKGGEKVFLDDLQESDFKVSWGKLAKHGEGVDEGTKITVKGTRPSHSLVAHPGSEQPSSVTYRLNKEYQQFKGRVTVPDGWHFKNSVVFEIVADDFTVWKSRQVSNSKDAQDFSVSVKGIKALELRVTCSGSASQTWPVWLNPVLLK